MPLLFYGTHDLSRRRLYSVGMKLVETSIFDSFKIKHLAPYSDKRWVANFWHLRKKNHCALSWHDEDMVEQTIFIPQLLDYKWAQLIARGEFPTVMPSSIVFRIHNPDGVYLYD